MPSKRKHADSAPSEADGPNPTSDIRCPRCGGTARLFTPARYPQHYVCLSTTPPSPKLKPRRSRALCSDLVGGGHFNLEAARQEWCR